MLILKINPVQGVSYLRSIVSDFYFQENNILDENLTSITHFLPQKQKVPINYSAICLLANQQFNLSIGSLPQ